MLVARAIQQVWGPAAECEFISAQALSAGHVVQPDVRVCLILPAMQLHVAAVLELRYVANTAQ
jgi:hypothetical protein